MTEGEGPALFKTPSRVINRSMLVSSAALQSSLCRKTRSRHPHHKTAMLQTSFRYLLLLSLSATFAKYVYIKDQKHWHDAQTYCRLNHTDLAPVSGEYDLKRLEKLLINSDPEMWIGMVRNSTDPMNWTWSGGGAVSTFFWEQGQPDNKNNNQDYGMILHYKWHDANDKERSFFCYNVFVVSEKKTWEEALEHCRENHTDLASVASDTEIMLMRTELAKVPTEARVWIGLRFLAGDWLWVDGQPLSYEAWGRGGRPECPQVTQKCGALRVTNAGLGPDDGEWEAFDCAESLDFICY